MRRQGWIVAFVLAGCGGPNAVPEKPTWVDDVEPILRGNCFHCHGAGSHEVAGAPRFDVYDVQPFADLGLVNAMTTDIESGRTYAEEFFKRAGGDKVLTRDLMMPPAPATLISTRDLRVLERWAAMADPPRGTRANNHLPTAEWLDESHTAIVVSDADRDQVLGRVSCKDGSMARPIDRTGTHMTPTCPLSVTLFDGQDKNDVTLE